MQNSSEAEVSNSWIVGHPEVGPDYSQQVGIPPANFRMAGISGSIAEHRVLFVVPAAHRCIQPLRDCTLYERLLN